MDRPDSLYVAAKLTAEAAGLQWSDVKPYYANLQPKIPGDDGAWLPKSVGRAVWYAHPHYVTRLLVALAAAATPAGAIEAVEWAVNTTPSGRDFHLTERPAANITAPFEREFSRFLVDPAAAAELQDVEFRSDRQEAVFTYKSGKQVVFARAGRGGEQAQPSEQVGIVKRGTILGQVFIRLAETVKWRTPDQMPFRGWLNGDEDAA